ncbi:MAG: hypothetical protein ACK5TP_00450 [bacterium]
MHTARCTPLLLTLALCAPSAIAQTAAQPPSPAPTPPAPAPPEPSSTVFPPLPEFIDDPFFQPLSVRDAINRSRNEGRVLVVVTRFMRPPQGRLPWWASASLRDWLTAEAIVIRTNIDNASLNTAIGNSPQGRLSLMGGIELFIDGQYIANAGGAVARTEELPDFTHQARGPADITPLPEGQLGITAEWVLGTIDAHRELAEAGSPVLPFRAARRRAAAGVRVVFPLHAPGSKELPAIKEPTIDPAAPWHAVVEQLTLAQQALEAGDPPQAIARYTWVWKRAEQTDPACALLVHTHALPRLLKLRDQTQLARTRLAELLDANPGDPDLPPGALLATAELARAVGVPPAPVQTAGLSRDQRAVHSAISVRAVLDIALRNRAAHEGGSTSPTGTLDETLVRAMLSQLRIDRPTISAEPAWQRLCALRRAVIIQEMTRGFLSSCAQGRDPQANAIARRLLASARTWPDADRATSARALALATIVAARVPRGLRPDLANALTEANTLAPTYSTAKLAGQIANLTDEPPPQR